MQPSTIVHGVPFRQEPRDGQKRIFDKAIEAGRRDLNVKLPTGYGKTLAAVGVYAIRQKHFGLNRLLFITPTIAQHEAFCCDGHHDLACAGVTGPHAIIDIGFYGAVGALKKHRTNVAQVFATTIQGLCGNNGNIVKALLETGRWMIVVDEYHHYGIDKAWGQQAKALNYEFLLAMSATPYRPDEDSAFGKPDVEVAYRDGVEQKAVKRLVGHSYIYKIDAIDADGEIKSMTSSELADAAGGCDPEKIEKFRIERKMRWSPKYVSPLVSIPIERMLSVRINTGYKVQAIIGAMCVSHAELVCDQLKTIFPELAIDWVGTGTNGRSNEANKAIIKKFCPPKKENNGAVTRDDPSLDVLVHVGIAGEGLDTCNVSEIVHLNSAGLNNSNNQENGRSSRYLHETVIGHINFDSSSEYSAYVGDKIMDAMDFLPPAAEEDKPEGDNDNDIEPLPEEPTIRIFDIELLNIDSGNPDVMRFAQMMKDRGATVRTLAQMVADENKSEYNDLLTLFRRMRNVEAEEHNERSRIMQYKDSVDSALSVVTGRIIKTMQKNGQYIEKSLPGDIKKRINGQKKRICGAVTNELETLRRHYQWLQALESNIIAGGIPEWLQ